MAQRYMAKPLLFNGLKFDLRVYALVISCDPLRIFVYREGLARFCTVPYAKPSAANLGTACMHLTNYAVNKHSRTIVERSGCADEARQNGADDAGEDGVSACSERCVEDCGCSDAADDSSCRDAADAACSREGNVCPNAGAQCSDDPHGCKWKMSSLLASLDSTGVFPMYYISRSDCLTCASPNW